MDNVKNVTILPMTERTNGIYDSISNYLDDNITVFNEYNQLLKDYEDLLNEIKEYNESLNIEKDYMHKMEDIEISTPLYLHHFDVLDNKNTKKYISYEINNFPTKLEDINKQLNKYIKNIFDHDYILNEVYVEGEISNFKESHGNYYFVLKDELSTVNCIYFDNMIQSFQKER